MKDFRTYCGVELLLCWVQENAGSAANAPATNSAKKPEPAAEPTAKLQGANPSESSRDNTTALEPEPEAEEASETTEGPGLSRFISF